MLLEALMMEFESRYGKHVRTELDVPYDKKNVIDTRYNIFFMTEINDQECYRHAGALVFKDGNLIVQAGSLIRMDNDIKSEIIIDLADPKSIEQLFSIFDRCVKWQKSGMIFYPNQTNLLGKA